MPRASEATPWVKARSLVTPCKGRSINHYVDLLNDCDIFITLLPLQGVNAMAIRDPGCRFACPGLGAHWAFSPPCLNPKLLCYIFPTSTRDMIRWVTHLTMPPIDPKNPTKPYRTFVEIHPYQPSQKCFFVNNSLNF